MLVVVSKFDTLTDLIQSIIASPPPLSLCKLVIIRSRSEGLTNVRGSHVVKVVVAYRPPAVFPDWILSFSSTVVAQTDFQSPCFCLDVD